MANRMILLLEENLSTGYQWCFTGASIIEDQHFPQNDKHGSGSEMVIGAGGERYVKIDLDDSKSQIVLCYKQNWDGGRQKQRIVIQKTEV